MNTNLLIQKLPVPLDKLPGPWKKLPTPLRERPLLLVIGVALLLSLAWWWLKPAKSDDAATAYHEVKLGDFTVTVVEGGALAAVNEVSVRNEVEGIARIISIVPEGSYVKKGDLLVELDSSQAQDQVNQQTISFEKAKFGVEAARAQLDILKSTTNSDYLAAKLKLEFAVLDLNKYKEGQQMVDLVEASNKLVQAQAQLAVNLDNYINSTNLASKGYETKQKVDGDRLSVLNTKNSLVVASNSIWILQQFDARKQLQKFEADVFQAEQELLRVASQNRQKMAQAEADLLTQMNTLKLSEDKLKRDQKNLAATKIYAPQDGLVVYQVSENRFSSESLIEGGATVRNRQELIKLPDLSRMKVTIKVHESHVGMVRVGQPAFVVLDSKPEERYRGVVEKVAPLPDTQARWGNPNLKVYNTDIYLTETIPNVKPGVSAKAEVIVTNIANAVSVPIQAVTTLKGKQVVYVAGKRNPDPQPVEVGLFNTKFIEITKGLKTGDRVLLSPPIDTNEKDLAGGIIAEGEARGLTNSPVRKQAGVAATGEAASAPGREGGTENGARSRNGEGRAGGGQERGNGGLAEQPGSGAMTGAGLAEGGEPRVGGGTNRLRNRPAGMPSREEMMKRFDKNGDGTLDEEEIAAMRASFGGRRSGGSGRSDRDGAAQGSRQGGGEAGAGEGRTPSVERGPGSGGSQ